jgi:hypothetical protein
MILMYINKTVLKITEFLSKNISLVKTEIIIQILNLILSYP